MCRVRECAVRGWEGIPVIDDPWHLGYIWHGMPRGRDYDGVLCVYTSVGCDGAERLRRYRRVQLLLEVFRELFKECLCTTACLHTYS